MIKKPPRLADKMLLDEVMPTMRSLSPDPEDMVAVTRKCNNTLVSLLTDTILIIETGPLSATDTMDTKQSNKFPTLSK